jgi:mono/diheme cytochrome c family protein
LLEEIPEQMKLNTLVRITLVVVPAVAAIALMFLVFAGPSISLAQNSNSSTTTNLNRSREIGPSKTGAPAPPTPGAGGAGPAPDFSKNTWELPPDASKTPNPVASTPESIAKGKELYLERSKGNCIFCHGESGSGNEANRGVLRRKPADLANHERMTSMTDGELFWKITKGIMGIMPAGERRLSEEERWQVVNYVRTLAKEPAK